MLVEHMKETEFSFKMLASLGNCSFKPSYGIFHVLEGGKKKVVFEIVIDTIQYPIIILVANL